MFNSIVIYTKPDCPWCEKMKDWFDMHELEYQIVEVGKDISGEELKAKAAPGEIKTVPQVFIGTARFGGYMETIAREEDVLRYKERNIGG